MDVELSEAREILSTMVRFYPTPAQKGRPWRDLTELWLKLSMIKPFLVPLAAASILHAAAQLPSIQQFTAQQPSTQQPSAQRPSAQRPSTWQLSTQQLSTQQLSAQQLSAQQLSAQQLSAHQSSAHQSSAQQPSAQQPTAQQPSAREAIPSIVENQGRHTLLVDGEPYFILGGQAHNSSAWPVSLPHVWSAIEKLHANTLEVPVYWEQIEPQEGKFDFSLVDTLLTQAREHQTRLVLLWFATWKNGSDHYMPAWMKLQPAKYPNCIVVKGDPVDSPSPIAEATLEADKKAFTAFMRYLKKADPAHTVIMVQVENEPGAWGTVRDYSPAAQRLFERPVPAALLQPDVLKALGHADAGTSGNTSTVGVRHFGDGTGHPMGPDGTPDAAGSGSNTPDAAGSGSSATGPAGSSSNNPNAVGSGSIAPDEGDSGLNTPDAAGSGSNATGQARPSGSWSNVFGADADEYFQAWYVARFIGEVAAAGKAEYPLPLYVNVALRDPLTHPKANSYESGGATDNVIPIYKIAAPAIDLVAPDIYLPEDDKCRKVIDLYTRPDNALLVPEAALKAAKVKYLYSVLAHGGIGFSPFGIDDNGGESPDAPDSCTPFAGEYALLAPLLPQLAQWAAQGRISALLEPDDHADQTVDLDGWQARAIFGAGRGDHRHPNTRATGKLLIIQQDRNTFLVTGTSARITFKPLETSPGAAGRPGGGKAWQYLRVEEGTYAKGVFTPTRILNGDETDWGGPAFASTPSLIRISLDTR
jgi:hypothetical protein